MVHIDEMATLQRKWGARIVGIGKRYLEGGDYRQAAEDMIDALYAYDHGGVLFKPTKAAQVQFRDTKNKALSYFVGGSIPEDHGFALNPWSRVRFENHSVVLDKDWAIGMGNAYFTDAHSAKEVQAEFTLGIRYAGDGHVVIFLHHSSLPYDPEGKSTRRS